MCFYFVMILSDWRDEYFFMVTKVFSFSISGIEVMPVHVEVDISNGLPNFLMTGYLGNEVKEASERVRTAIKNTGYRFPPNRIVVNISPANIRKNSTGFDLPIAIGILSDLGEVCREWLDDTLIMGELSLDGRVNPIRGVLAGVGMAKQAGFRRCIVPKANEAEGSAIEGISVIGVETLSQAVAVINQKDYTQRVNKIMKKASEADMVDFADVYGQETIKRSSMIAVAGRHNMLMIGPPGSGKTLAAKRIPTIMPDMTLEEKIDITKVYSIIGTLSSEGGLIEKRPFRAPHHSISLTGLIGGGRYPVPGEITLADKGVLFLDELTEFNPRVLDALRQPFEEKSVTLVKGTGTYVFPADCMIVAAMNPCKCGYYPDNRCTCSPAEIDRYIGRISKPLLDRFDITVSVSQTGYKDISGGNKNGNMSSAQMKEKVIEAIERQKYRYKASNICYNAQLNGKLLRKYCKVTKEAQELLEMVYSRMSVTARGYDKILKVARTVADMEGQEHIMPQHICEAVAYRNTYTTEK